MEPDVGEVREQKSANEIALSQRSMNVARIIPKALSLSPRVYISSWTGFDALNADSDDRAQAFRFDAAQRSDLIARS